MISKVGGKGLDFHAGSINQGGEGVFFMQVALLGVSLFDE